MNYKVLSTVLGLLLAAAFVFIVAVCIPHHGDYGNGGSPRISSAPLDSGGESIDPALVAYWQRPKGPVRQRGKFVKLYKLILGADRYRQMRKRDSLLSKHPYAFLFGMDQMRDLVARYDSYTSGHREDSIHGVRVFLVLNETVVDSLGTTKEHFDLIMSPVGKNGKNTFTIGDPGTDSSLYKSLGEPELFLNTSSPCPDMCN